MGRKTALYLRGMGAVDDFFEMLFGNLGGRTGGFGGREQTTRMMRGQDNEHDVTISLEEAFSGTTVGLQWEDGRRIEAKIPPGVRTGSRVRLSGQGQQAAGGGQAGDLYLKVRVSPHARFKRDGDNLKTTVPIDLYTALLGGKIDVHTLDRKVELSIPAETANGKTFRLRGLGMPKLRDSKNRGNLYVTVNIQLPKNLSQEEINLFQKLQKLRGS